MCVHALYNLHTFSMLSLDRRVTAVTHGPCSTLTPLGVSPITGPRSLKAQRRGRAPATHGDLVDTDTLTPTQVQVTTQTRPLMSFTQTRHNITMTRFTRLYYLHWECDFLNYKRLHTGSGKTFTWGHVNISNIYNTLQPEVQI